MYVKPRGLVLLWKCENDHIVLWLWDMSLHVVLWAVPVYVCGFTIWRWPQRNVMSVRVMLELTQVQLDHYFTSISQCSTNQIVQNLTSGIEFDWWNLPWLLQCSRCLHRQHHYCELASCVVVDTPKFGYWAIHIWKFTSERPLIE